MKNLIWALGLLALIIAGPASSEENSSRDTVTFSFKNKTLTMHQDFFGGDDLVYHHGTVIEKDPSGKVIQKLKVKKHKGTWSPVVLSNGIYFTTHTTGTKDIGLSFKTTISTGVLKTSTEENVICSSCSAGTTGVCQNSRSKTCADLANGMCPRRMRVCTEYVIVERPVFSQHFESHWKFQDPANTLHYEYQLNTKKAKTRGKRDKTNSISLQDKEGFLAIPGTAVIIAPDGSKRIIDVKINSEFGEKKNTISFEFPSFPEGSMLKYN